MHPELWQRWFFPLVLTRKRVGDGARMLSGGRFCRRLYRALTIPARAQGIREPISVGGSTAMLWAERNRTCGNTDSRPPDRRRFVHRQRRRLTPKCSVNWIFAGHFDCRCVDRSSRGGRSEGAQETGPRQRPQRTRRPRYPQAWTARRKRGPINARTPQGCIRGPDREVRGCRAGYGPRRNRPACCGRAGEGWGPLDPGHKFRKSESPEVIELSPKSGLPKGPTRILSAAWWAYISLPRVGSDNAPKNKK